MTETLNKDTTFPMPMHGLDKYGRAVLYDKKPEWWLYLESRGIKVSA